MKSYKIQQSEVEHGRGGRPVIDINGKRAGVPPQLDARPGEFLAVLTADEVEYLQSRPVPEPPEIPYPDELSPEPVAVLQEVVDAIEAHVFEIGDGPTFHTTKGTPGRPRRQEVENPIPLKGFKALPEYHTPSKLADKIGMYLGAMGPRSATTLAGDVRASVDEVLSVLEANTARFGINGDGYWDLSYKIAQRRESKSAK